jgi:hypothetical protein
VGGERVLRDLVSEYKATGPGYRRKLHQAMRRSYQAHYRRLLPPLLETLQFRSNNDAHQPIVQAVELLKRYVGSKARTFRLDEVVPIRGVVRPGWRELVLEHDKKGRQRVNRISYELFVLEAVRERVRCKEVWVGGADHYRNPDDDLPGDFAARRDAVPPEAPPDLGPPHDADESPEFHLTDLGNASVSASSCRLSVAINSLGERDAAQLAAAQTQEEFYELLNEYLRPWD